MAVDLVGRRGDLRLVGEFVRQASTCGGSFLVHGAPGAGKSALADRHQTPRSMALGLGDMPVANAVVELFQIASVDRPLLVIVDDLHQVDAVPHRGWRRPNGRTSSTSRRAPGCSRSSTR